MGKIKLDAAKGELPEKKSDIDKMYIVQYTKLHGTPEQRAAIKQLIKDNTEEKMSQLTKKTYQDVRIKPIRDKFCDFFFPQFNTKKAAKTFFDLVDEL